RAGTNAPTHSCVPRLPPRSSRRPTVQQLQIRATRESSNGVITLTAAHIIDPAGLPMEALGDAAPDLMRSLLQTMINARLSEHADVVVGANGAPRAGPSAKATVVPHMVV